MSEKEQWYGTDVRSYTTLIFGEVIPGKAPEFSLAYFGKEAYELFQTGVYMKNIAEIRGNTDYICWTPSFDLFYEAFRLLSSLGDIVLEEIGSTLFATIDKFEKLALRYGDAITDRVIYFGVEPMDSFQAYAKILHPVNRITHFNDWRALPPAAPITISRSYQATSYAFETTSDLCAWISRSSLSSQGVWFSATGSERTTKSLGKRLQLFGFDEFVDCLAASGKRVAVYESERFSFSGDEFIAAWLLVYDPTAIDVDALNGLFVNRFGKGLDDPSFLRLQPPGAIREHAHGIDQTKAFRHRLDSTFNFQCKGIESVFEMHRKGL